MDRIYLGKIGTDSIYITKHSWDCNWYWSFGYLGNKNWHFHVESLIHSHHMKEHHLNKSVNYSNFTNIDTIFTETWLTQANWWVIRDLFIQAYALKQTAEVYRHGGNQTTLKGIIDILTSKDKENNVNADLKKLLDITWQYLINSKHEADSLTKVNQGL